MDCFVVALLAMTALTSSLQGFEKAVAILFILGSSLRELLATRGNLDMATTIPNQNSSLRRPKACGNLVYSWPVIARL